MYSPVKFACIAGSGAWVEFLPAAKLCNPCKTAAGTAHTSPVLVWTENLALGCELTKGNVAGQLHFGPIQLLMFIYLLKMCMLSWCSVGKTSAIDWMNHCTNKLGNYEKISDKHFKSKGHLSDENYSKGNCWFLCFHVEVWEGRSAAGGLWACCVLLVLNICSVKKITWFSQNMFIYNPCRDSSKLSMELKHTCPLLCTFPLCPKDHIFAITDIAWEKGGLFL